VSLRDPSIEFLTANDSWLICRVSIIRALRRFVVCISPNNEAHEQVLQGVLAEAERRAKKHVFF